ncbi:MAG: hypothetical protein Q9166_005902 [cf. Caloplaca sp. 2 TL-2023]
MNGPGAASIPPEVLKQDRGPRLVIIIWVFASLTLTAVSIKVWTRIKVLHRSGLEDFLMLSAWVLSVIYGALVTASVHMGLGRHPYAIDPTKISHTLKLYTIAMPFGVLFSFSLPSTSAAICALVRLAYVSPLGDLKDYTYKSINHTMWAVIEGNAIIIAACIPGLCPFVKYVHSKNLTENLTRHLPSCFLPSSLREKHRPSPLPLGCKSSQHNASDASTSLPTPLSPRRMEPRSSGSVSGSLHPTNHRLYRQNSFARIESTSGRPEEVDFGYGCFGKEKKMTNVSEKGKEVEEPRGTTGSKGAGQVVEMCKGNSGVDEEEERENEVQGLREMLEENRAEKRMSWLEKVRARVDKRMTI